MKKKTISESIVIEGIEFSPEDISSIQDKMGFPLRSYDLKLLRSCKTLDEIIAKSIYGGDEGLFSLYAFKVGFTEENINKQYDGWGSTPLGFAVARGLYDIVEMLLKTEVGRNALLFENPSYIGESTVLSDSIWFKEENGRRITNAILETKEGQESLMIKGPDGTPLRVAISRNPQIAEDMLNYPKGIESLAIQDANGDTALHAAVRMARMGVVRKILELPEGAKLANIKNKEGQTPLDLFALTDFMRHTPLHHSGEDGTVITFEEMQKWPKIQESLTMKDGGGNTPLHSAALSGSVEAIKEILKLPQREELLAIQNEEGNTPLHSAALSGNIEVIKEILKLPQRKELLTIKNEKGKTPLDLFLASVKEKELTPLHIANKKNSYDRENFYGKQVFDGKDLSPLWLLGANPNLSAPDKRTPLMVAASEGNIEAMKDLLLHGADPYIKTKDGLTVTDFISPDHRANITSLLQSYKEVEQEFKNGFEKKFLEAIRKKGSNPNKFEFADVFHETLKTCYKPTSSDNTEEKLMLLAPLYQYHCKFNFITKFFLRIASVLGITSHEELLMNKVSEAIQGTEEFGRFISHTDIGKEAVASYVKKVEAKAEVQSKDMQI